MRMAPRDLAAFDRLTLEGRFKIQCSGGPRSRSGIRVTQLLQRALNEAQTLPAAEQDAIAAIILEELADERRWDAAFAISQDRLSRLAEKVRRDVAAGSVRETGIDEL